jgi:beta-lactamase superfamily II metal-dependent hydrolase
VEQGVEEWTCDLSHPHPDHMNGLKFILKKFEVAELDPRDGQQPPGMMSLRK